ncbi:G-protein alpha subunit [Irpex rosettiformis]|uniref:G-protein alpha subunit n=1 Tax=Irpex rosettiformis TaxID=378272 RepID=A0ACB8U1G8_9APHY|nr:G-protein alpha subunit [Irpex rosettiformis]
MSRSSKDAPVTAASTLWNSDDLPKGDEEQRRVSLAIDESLRQERELRKKRRAREVKVMLLGQAESGKSTLQKQFQLYYASQTLDRERPSWRPIVYSNILKALRMLFDELDRQYSLASGSDSANMSQTPPSANDPLQVAGSSSFSASSSTSSTTAVGTPSWPSDLQDLQTVLNRLISHEDELASEVSGGISVSGGRTGVFVRAGWQTLISPNRTWPVGDIRAHQPSSNGAADLIAQLLQETKCEIEEFWRHPMVKKLLASNKVRLEESASFFLDEIERIANPGYLPSTDDILHVRLQTLGVQEHSFDIDIGGVHFNWLLYDVGGARGQRHAWVPFFEDATAIIFLAPMSAFDQYLDEDPRTNRIDDSLQLFTAICQNKLLSKAALVLMLNKADLLKKKLEAGVKIRKFISSFGDRPNTYEEVSEYFRAHFIQTHRRRDVSNRALYTHFTSMLDIKATQSIIINVGEAIMRSHMNSIGLS